MFGTYSKTTKILVGAMAAALLLILCVTLLPTPAKAATQGDFSYEVSNGEAGITDYTGSAKNLTIPSTLGGYPVTRIGIYAFEDCSSLTSITIPDSVTSIGWYAFYECSSLTSITIPDSVTSIGYYAFEDCSSLTSITIGNGVTSIGDRAFYYCSSLASITIPDSVTSIGSSAFSGCSNLESITIPDSVTSIGYDAFYQCSSLASITIGNSVTSIGSSAFYKCSSLTSITIPDSVTSIGNYAFSICSSLTSITIGNGVTSIGDRAFYYCSSLASITIPDSVTSIGYSAFSGCSSLTSITIPDSVTSIGYSAFRDCSSLTSITIPDSVTSIGSSAFSGCSSLTSITIPDGVTSIGEYAFRDCSSLTSITIPDSVTSIGDEAFYICSRIADVYYGGTESQWNEISIGSYNGELTRATIHYNHVHDYSLFLPVTVDATCTEDGYIEYTCAWGESYRLVLPALEHDFSGEETGLKPTCTENGYIVTQCIRCAETIKEITNSVGHDFSGKETVVDPTCTEQGYTVVQCIRCAETTTKNITDSLGHDFSGKETVVEPTCTERGYTVVQCIRCTETTTKHITNSVGHDFSGNETVVEPTCTEQGYTVVQCIRCKETEKQKITAAVGHKFQIVPAVAPTCTESGLTAGTACQRCGLVGIAQQTVEALGHSVEYGTCVSCGFQEEYTVIFMDESGAEISKATYHYGDKVTVPADPSKAADNTYTYTFAGWDKEVVDCAGNATYTATYTATYIDYTVTFLDESGTEISKKTYHYGDKVTAPVDPTKAADNTYTYTFAGWDKEVVDCAGNATYTATYTASYIDYMVTFLDESGTEISKKTYHYGDKVTAPADPTKAADNTYTYTFAGWDREVVDCAGNATYTATYTATYIDYTVTFLDESGTEISKKTYHYGDKVTAPADPTKAADNTYTYTFAGWDKEVADCAGNATYTATYTASYIDYTVTFLDESGTEISKATYHYGDKVTAPADPAKAADNTYTYAFAGWDKEVVDCAGNATYTATYTATYLDYTVIFQNEDGTEISKATYHYGDKVTAPADPTKTADNTYTYAFAGWDKEVVDCAGNATYTATYTATYIDYTVTFLDEGGAEISKATYHYGDKVTAPADPTKTADNTYTYAFAGWDKEVVDCAGNATYTATYTVSYIDYTVIFQNEDGTEISKATYRYGDKVTAPADPTKAADNTYTYTFAGWDKEVVDCVGDATYTATYTAAYIDYAVIFRNEDGTEISKATYRYGDKVTAPADPTKAADNTYTYAFAGWDKEVVDCVGNATYTATYTATYIDYTVIFQNEDGTEISKATYHYGDTVEIPADPQKEATANGKYSFIGWDKEITPVTGDATYRAQFAFEQTLPDFTGDGEVTDADAVYLLRHTLFGEDYPLSGNGDVNSDGEVTDADAVYLLRYTLFGEDYPLYPKKKDE